MAKDYSATLREEIESHGGRVVDIEVGRKHRKIHFEFRGESRFYVYSGSPSDWRGLENALSDLRKVMGVKRQVHKNAANRSKKRNRSQAVELPEHITPGPEGMEAIYRYMPEPEPWWKRVWAALRTST